MFQHVKSDNVTTFGSLFHQAYERWDAHESMSKLEFWCGLSDLEQIVVFVAELEYQVPNGGFLQWCENGYEFTWVKLAPILEQVGTPATLEVAKLVRSVAGAFPGYCFEHQPRQAFKDFCESCDTGYYRIHREMMDDVTRYVEALIAREL